MSGTLLFFATTLTLGGIYAALAMILNLTAGWAGVWDLGMAGTVGVAAYVYTIATITPEEFPSQTFALGLPVPVAILLSGAVTALVALLIGVPSLRLRGEYFLITTFAFAEVARQLMINQSDLTGGTVGLNQLDRPFQDAVESGNYRYVLLAMTFAVVLALYFLMKRIGRSPYGTQLRSLRDNEPLARALGKNVVRHRIQTFVLAGALVGLVTPLYVWYLRRVVPDLFAADLTFTVWTALVIGGIGSFRGPAVGAIFLILLMEAVQFLQVDADQAVLLSSLRPLILGIVLILVLRLRPDGLFTERRAFERTAAPPQRPPQSGGEPTFRRRSEKAGVEAH
jgi:branched-chain amino acid transport system permease protein